MEEQRSWGFADATDAKVYLREVGTLWATWIAGLAALVVGSGWLILPFGVAVIAGLLWAARPLQARAAKLVPEDSVVGGKRSFLVGRSTERDLVLRQLAYGDAPLRAAVDTAGAPRLWLTARLVVLGLTVAAFVWVLTSVFAGPAPS